MGVHGLNQRTIIKGCFLDTQVGARFMLAAKSIILFPKPGKLSCCYHLQGMLALFINALLAHVFILQTFISSSYMLAASQGARGDEREGKRGQIRWGFFMEGQGGKQTSTFFGMETARTSEKGLCQLGGSEESPRRR